MHLPSLAAAAATAAALLSTPLLFAEPVSAAFDPVVIELNARDAALGTPSSKEEKAQRRALDQAFRALDRPSDALSGDLRIAKKVTAAVDRGYPDDGEVGGLLDDLLDALRDDVELSAEQVEALVLTLEDGGPRTKAEARLALAASVLATAEAAPTRTKRAGVLARAEKKVGQAEAAARKGSPAAPDGNATMSALVGGDTWQATPSLGAGVSGGVLVDGETGGVRDLLIRGRMYLYSAGPDPDFLGTRTIEIRITSTLQDLAPGTYEIGPGGSFTAAATFTDEDAGGDGPVYYATSGSITLTSVTGAVTGPGGAGTFGFTGWDPATEETVAVSQGAFNVTGLPRTVR